MAKRPIGRQVLQQYDVNLKNQVEELSWSFYHFQTYAAAGQTELSFFNAAPGSLSLQDYNMTLAGQIPAGQSFLVESIACEFQPAEQPHEAGATESMAFLNDLYNFGKNGLLEFSVGSKLYVQEGPLGRFPPSYRVAGQSAIATTVAASASITDYGSWAGQTFEIVPVRLTSNQNFKVSMKWASAITVSANARVGVRLQGRLFRNAQ